MFVSTELQTPFFCKIFLSRVSISSCILVHRLFFFIAVHVIESVFVGVHYILVNCEEDARALCIFRC